MNRVVKKRFNFNVVKQGMSSFVQDAPCHENAFTSDAFLIRILKRMIPPETFNDIEPDLVQFGDRVRNDIWHLGVQCEREPPFLRAASPWGASGNELVTSPAWKAQKDVAAEEGLISIAYEQKQGQYSRLYQAAKLMMYSPASGLYSCPLAMTDGAAHTLKSCDQNIDEVRIAYQRLTSRDPKQFWTSGQWMTEKRGGSDVSAATETVAEKVENDWKISGYKWFSSATDCDISLALARTDQGLSLFMIKLRDEQDQLQNIEIVKLKNKLGTRQLPTAELRLTQTPGLLLSTEGRGLPHIAGMLNITRIHNIISSVAIMRKVTSLARDYSQRRMAFGRRIAQHPLHLKTLANLEVDVRGCTALLFDLARQQGLKDMQMIDENEELLLRLMTPVAKMYTAKKAVSTSSEGIECFGGQGYIEDTFIPGYLRDAQVLPIWEGTSNVMALDVLRALSKSKGVALRAFKTRVSVILQESSKSNDASITYAAQQVKVALLSLIDFAAQNQLEPAVMEIAARDFTLSMAHIYIGSLLIEQALHSQHKMDAIVARQWALTRDMCPVDTMQKANGYRLQREGSQIMDMVFENYNSS